MSGARQFKKEAETTVRRFVSELPKAEQQALLHWSQQAIAIRESSNLSRIEKVKALKKLGSSSVAKTLIIGLLKALQKVAWTNQSWARRLGLLSFATAGITFGGTSVGIATLGAGIGVPLAVLTAGGGALLGLVVDEILKDLKKGNAVDDQ